MTEVTTPKVRLDRKFVKQLLIEKEIDQRDLAHLSGVSEPTITRLLHGRAFSSETLGRLAGALGVHPIDLIDGRGFPAPQMDAPAAVVAG